jgi:hypothetical protein
MQVFAVPFMGCSLCTLSAKERLVQAQMSAVENFLPLNDFFL